MKLTAGVNFINILYAIFLYKSAMGRFSLITVWLCNSFCQKNICAKLLIKCWWNWQQEELLQRRLARSIPFTDIITLGKIFSCQMPMRQDYKQWWEWKYLSKETKDVGWKKIHCVLCFGNRYLRVTIFDERSIESEINDFEDLIFIYTRQGQGKRWLG